MIICFDLSGEAKAALEKLLKTGQFADRSEAISMAVINYEVIQRAVAEKGQFIVDTQRPQPPKASRGSAEAPRASEQAPAPSLSIPTLFAAAPSLEGLEFLDTPQTPPTLNISPKDWPWGQYNRLLPVKATCRALLNIARQNPRGIPVDQAAAKISFDACGLGDFLTDLDARWHRRREDALASAFPTSAFNAGESRLRFGSQFVGAMKQGKLIGFPASLRFVGCDASKDCRLMLTKAGADFALMENPIFEAGNEPMQRKLSEAEMRFLLDHIRRVVPEEASAFAAIVDAIDSGANTPDKLDQHLCRRFNLEVVEKATKPTEITQTFLTTQRTGAVSRMADLDLLLREKKGLHVTYVTTHPGKYFRSQMQ